MYYSLLHRYLSRYLQFCKAILASFVQFHYFFAFSSIFLIPFILRWVYGLFRHRRLGFTPHSTTPTLHLTLLYTTAHFCRELYVPEPFPSLHLSYPVGYDHPSHSECSPALRSVSRPFFILPPVYTVVSSLLTLLHDSLAYQGPSNINPRLFIATRRLPVASAPQTALLAAPLPFPAALLCW
jgi:hypothetical protein